MPDEDAEQTRTKLTEDERKLILGKLQARGAPKACEACGTDNWQFGEYVTSPVVVKRLNGGLLYDLAGRLHVSATLICLNCGNTKFYNIRVLGLDDVFKPINEDSDIEKAVRADG